MKRNRIALGIAGGAVLAGLLAGAWLMSLPPGAALEAPAPIAQAELDATLAALKPPKRERPLVAIVGINDATETTDYLMPHFWNREQLSLELSPGVDQVSLALVADAWSRTYRSRAVTFASSASAGQTQSGLRIVPEQIAASWPAQQRLPPIGSQAPAKALDATLHAISARYGAGTAAVVAMQLEYPQHGARP